MAGVMLSIHDLEFEQLYPNYCKTYDAMGRRIRMIESCNPETGEVVRLDLDAYNLLMRLPFAWRFHSKLWIPRRHGFFPAPLTIVPNP
jgi:hypothetical protein